MTRNVISLTTRNVPDAGLALTTTEIGAWLEGLELAEYASVFQAEKISLENLADLTDADLRELGLPLGPRKSIIRAASQRDWDHTPTGEPASHLPDPEPKTQDPGAISASAERRQITVMFCDLVGSTELSATLDPEDLREVMTSYQRAAGAVVTRYEGHVAQYLGDGLMVYFGWPQAHEDDPERAVRAGLEIVETIKSLESPTNLSVRIGIATGPVVVGETGDGGPSVSNTAVGETPNLAARIQGLAEVNTVAIAPQVRRLVAGAFELDSFGKQDLKGITDLVEVFRVIGEAPTESRFEAQSTGGLTPFVGREPDIGMLLERWEQAKDGEGQVVLLKGEAGIGKSRVAQVFRERVAEEPHVRLRYQCSPYHTNSAFYPITRQFERAAGFVREDTPEQELAKMEVALETGTSDVAVVAPLFAAMLSLPVERYRPLNLSPQRQKEKIIEALADQVDGLAKNRPVLMILEDAQWIDPTTQDAFDLVVGRAYENRVLLIVVCRPEYEPPWVGQSHVTQHSLGRLSRRQATSMADRVAGGKQFPKQVLEQIIAKTDGVPLFVEELTKTVIESSLLHELSDRYELDGPLPPLAIPATLQDSLMARLDRLAQVKEIAQIGAVVGREISYELLAEVAQLGEPALLDALDQLVASQLMFQRGAPPNATYTFKNALIQDVAYASLLKGRRQQIHARIGEILETKFPDVVKTHPETLAGHFAGAGLAEMAALQWLEAGRRAAQRSAHVEATAHFRSGVDEILALPEDAKRHEQELDLQTTLGMSLIATKGPGSPETRDTYARAQVLCDKLGDRERVFPVLYGQAALNYIKGEIVQCLDANMEFLRLAQQSDNEALILTGHRIVGTTNQMLGNFASSREHLETAIDLYRPDEHRTLALEYGHDPLATGNAVLSVVSWALGYPDKSRVLIDQAVALATELRHPHTLAIVLSCAGWVGHLLRDASSAREHSHALMTLSNDNQFPVWLETAKVMSGWATAAEGDPSEGLAQAEDGLNGYQALGGMLTRPFLFSLLAKIHAGNGEMQKALHWVDKALTVAQESRECWWLSELLRAKGTYLVAMSGAGSDKAEESLLSAIECAKSQQARLLELRSAISLARLLRSQGRNRGAHDLLAPVYNWFTEGFDTVDLKEAKVLLEELK
jgi:class 3 adenylate cyclase/predicted ATPase